MADKKALLTKNMTEMCHIRGAIKFNPLTASFDVEQRGERGSPDIGITQESIKNLYSSVSTARDIVKLMAKLSSLQLPHEVMILLIPVVSLSADGLTLERKTFVENSQVEYLNLIYRFLIHALPPENIYQNFSKVMTALVDLRESADKSNKQKINPASYSSPDQQSHSVTGCSQ